MHERGRLCPLGDNVWKSDDCVGDSGREVAVDGPGGGDDLGYTVAIGIQNRIVVGGSMSNMEESRDGWVAVFSP